MTVFVDTESTIKFTIIKIKNISGAAGSQKMGEQLAKGVYFVALEKNGQRSLPVKVVKE